MIPRIVLAALAAATVAASPAAAQQARSGWGAVQSVEAGWVQNTMGVLHSAPLVNPAGCTITGAGYATNPADPGVNLFHTLLLSALLNRIEVQLLVEGCAFNKPRIIAVTLR